VALSPSLLAEAFSPALTQSSQSLIRRRRGATAVHITTGGFKPMFLSILD
jgi:hypothetical protein